MLVITRRPQQSFVLHDREGNLVATVMLTEIDRDKVRIGIEAPEDILIYRSELLSDHAEGGDHVVQG